MDLTIARPDLAALLSRAASVAKQKSPQAALSCVVLDAADDTVTARATDLMLGVEVTSNATVKKPGTVAVEAKRAAEIANNMPAGDVRIRIVGNQLELSSGKYKTKLGIFPHEEFPSLPALATATLVATLSGADLLHLLTTASYAAKHDDTRPAQGSTLVTFAADGVRAYSAETGRMATTRVACDVADPKAAQMLVPDAGMGEVKAFAKSAGQDVVAVSRSHSQAFFATGRRVLSVKLGDDIFPAVQKLLDDRVIPGVKSWTTLNREALHSAIKRVALTPKVTAGAESVLLTFSADIGEVVITGASGSNEGTDSVVCEGAHNVRLEVAPRFLLDALSSIADDEVRIGISGDMDPLVFRGATNDNQIGVVMPMRQS